MEVKNIRLGSFTKEIHKRKGLRLITITAVDRKDHFSLYYHFDYGKIETLKVNLPKEKPIIQSIIFEFPIASFYEREIHDFFGIEFEGNPHLHEKLFLPDDWKGRHPHKK